MLAGAVPNSAIKMFAQNNNLGFYTKLYNLQNICEIIFNIFLVIYNIYQFDMLMWDSTDCNSSAFGVELLEL